MMRPLQRLRHFLPACALTLALGSAGCLITDPIIPIDSQGNLAPEFLPGRPQPATGAPLTYPVGSTTVISFDASSRDPDGSATTLQYKWVLDQSSTPVLNGEDKTQFSTTPAVLGAGTHTLHVTIRDDGIPTGILETEWQIVVQ